MEYGQISKQIMEFQKLTFTNCFNAVVLLQDQATSVMSRTVQQNTWLPEQGQKMIQSWVDTCQQERERFKTYVDDGFAYMETCFAVEKPVRKTAKKAKAVKKKKVTATKKQ